VKAFVLDNFDKTPAVRGDIGEEFELKLTMLCAPATLHVWARLQRA
jgi:hypothetical protein